MKSEMLQYIPIGFFFWTRNVSRYYCRWMVQLSHQEEVVMVTIPEYCESVSPTLRCSEVRRGPDDSVLVCVKYKGHKTPCHFEPFPGGKAKTPQFACPACGYVEKG